MPPYMWFSHFIGISLILSPAGSAGNCSVPHLNWQVSTGEINREGVPGTEYFQGREKRKNSS